MAMAARGVGRGKLSPEVNRILYIKNLPYKITAEELYDIFGKFGAIHQIRMFVILSKFKIHHHF
jgi:pre-mRNA branch site protein p14